MADVLAADGASSQTEKGSKNREFYDDENRTGNCGSPLFTASTVAEAQVFGPTVQRGRDITTQDMVRENPRFPRDIYRRSPRLGPRHRDLATYAWLQFISLNVPANLYQRGKPAGSFMESGFASRKNKRPLVWETFQHRSELFPFNVNGAVPPQTFNGPPIYIFNVDGRAFDPGIDLFNNLDEASQIGLNQVFFPARDGSGEDFQVLFQVKVNQVESEYVRKNFDSLIPPLDLPNNAVELKTAWRPIESIPRRERGRYHTATAIFYSGEDSDPVAETGKFALIAMHVMQKTENYPTWTYATFEHVDVLQSQASGRDTGFYYVPNYDNIVYSLPETTDNNFPPETVTNPPARFFDVNAPRARPNGKLFPLPVGDPADIAGAVVVDGIVKVPVVQPPTTNRAVERANRQVLRAMRRIPGFDESFIWQYYRLKGVQAVPSNRQGQKDFYLANIAIESSQPGLQVWRGAFPSVDPDSEGVQTLSIPFNQVNVYDPVQDKFFAAGGCIGCHGAAATVIGQDFSFLFHARDGEGHSPQTVGDQDDETHSDRRDDSAGDAAP